MRLLNAALVCSFVVVLGLGACATEVVGGGDDDSGDDDSGNDDSGNDDSGDGDGSNGSGSNGNGNGSGGDGSGDDTPAAGLGYTIDMSGSYGLEPRDSFNTYGAGGPPEDRFVVQIADHDGASCARPDARPECPTPTYQVSVSVPVWRAVVGNTVQLAGDPTIYVQATRQEDRVDVGCVIDGFAPVPVSGTLTYVAAGQGTMDVRFDDTSDPLLDGLHTIRVCE